MATGARRVRFQVVLCMMACGALVTATAVAQGGSSGTKPPVRASTPQQWGPAHLLTDGTDAPLGLGSTHPRLTWQLKSSTPGILQSAYRIDVATSPASLKENSPDVWDSGRVTSSEQAADYSGPALHARQRYFWRVRVWSDDGKNSGWSAPSSWEEGLLSPHDWAPAQWISATRINTSQDRHQGYYLRKTFQVTGAVKSARLYFTTLGYLKDCFASVFPQACRISSNSVIPTLNGHQLSDRQLDVAPTTSNRALYTTLDVTRFVNTGSNVIGLSVAGDAYLLARLEIKTKDGRQVVVVTDGTWLKHKSPYRHVDRFSGTVYDARLEIPGWNTSSLHDLDGWSKVALLPPFFGFIKMASAATLPPMRIVKLWHPVSIKGVAHGGYTLDFGQNISGRVHIRLRGAPGKEIRIVQSERLTRTGEADAQSNGLDALQTDHYTFGTSGRADWSPQFSYYGFRYATIYGLTTPPSKADVWAEEVNTDLRKTGSFATSDSLIQRIHEAAVQTTLNNAHGIPEDCPQREKRGWAADGYVSDPQAFANFDMFGFYRKWLGDIRNSQLSDGSVPDIAPAEAAYAAQDGDSDWGLVAVELPWDLYQRTGDLDVLRDNYRMMKRFIDWDESKAVDGILAPQSLHGDWLAPDRTYDPLLRSALWYIGIEHLISSAKLLGKTTDAQTYSELAERVRRSFNQHFLDMKTGIYGPPGSHSSIADSEASQALPIAAGLVPEKELPRVTQQLVRVIQAHQDHPDTGLNATRFLLSALLSTSHFELIDQMAHQTSAPSWGYMVEHGPGSLWESWTAGADGGSLDHAWSGSIDAYFYRLYAGIRAASPGFHTSVIEPYAPPGMRWVRASEETPYGPISSSWRRERGGIRFDVTIPAGTTAQVVLPARGGAATLLKNGRPVRNLRGVRRIAASASNVTYRVVSGNYAFRVPH